MAEILGPVTGTMSFVGLFKHCVSCFEHIQLGPHFGEDYRVCQLRLEIARTRLGRLGEAVHIYDDVRFSLPPGGLETKGDDDKDVKLAREILEEIMILLETAAKTSKRYELRAKEKNLAPFDREKDLSGVHLKLHQRLRTLVGRRLKGGWGDDAELARKAAWVLYDAKQFEKLITQVLELVAELEDVFSAAEAALRKLAAADVVEVCGGEEVTDEEESLKILRGLASETDEVLVDAVAKRLKKMSSVGDGDRNYAKEIKATDKTQVQVGHEFTEAVLLASGSFPFGTTNAVDVILAKKSARVHVGSRFGTRN